MMRWNSGKTYTEDDIVRMQREAVERAREFQSRARQAPTIYDVPPEELLALPEEPPVLMEAAEAPMPSAPPEEPSRRPEGSPIEAESRVISPPAQQTRQGPADPIGGLLDKFNLDSESLLILGLIFLLYNEQADNILLLALGYLLL